MAARITAYFYIAFILIAALVSACGAEPEESIVINKPQTRKTGAGSLVLEIKRGIIDMGDERGIVKIENVNIKSDSLKKLNEKYRLVSIEKLFSGTRSDTPSDIYVFRFSEKTNIGELSSAYKQNADVIYAEPNYVVSAQ